MLCYSEAAHTATYSKAGTGSISKPSCFTYSGGPASPSLIVNCNTKADIGVYTIVVTGSLASPPAGMSPTSANFTFVVTIQSDCVNTTWNTGWTVNNMTAAVGGAAATQTVFLNDSISTARTDTTWCGTRTYTFSPTKTFISVSALNVLTV